MESITKIVSGEYIAWMRISNMKSNHVPKWKVINQKLAVRDANCEKGDCLPCSYCGREIGYNGIETRRGMVHDRRHRVDISIGDLVESYHLPCYDLAVLGYVRHNTIETMKMFPCYKQFTYVVKRNDTGDTIQSQSVEITYKRRYACGIQNT